MTLNTEDPAIESAANISANNPQAADAPTAPSSQPQPDEEEAPLEGFPEPRPTSFIHRLTSVQKAELHSLLAKLSRAEVLRILNAPAPSGMGIQVSYKALRRYHEYIRALYAKRSGTLARYWDALHAVQAVPAPYTQLAHERLRDYYFDLAIKPWADP